MGVKQKSAMWSGALLGGALLLLSSFFVFSPTVYADYEVQAGQQCDNGSTPRRDTTGGAAKFICPGDRAPNPAPAPPANNSGTQTPAQEQSDDDGTTCAIEKGKTSKHEPFNDQFLNKYLEQTSKYIEAVDVMTTATNSETAISANKTMSEAYGKILDLGANKLDFKLPDLMSELESLKETLDSQKNAFWR